MTSNLDTQIHTRALLVWLRISTWSARKYDRTVTNKVNAQYASTSDAGRYNKHLLPGDAKAYKALITLAGSIRAQHYAHTLAWSDEGWRLLPTANYIAYTEWLRGEMAKYSTLTAEFVSEYPTMRAQAARLLNGLYKDEDYPQTRDLQSRFTLGVEYAPVPAQGDVRVNLGTDTVSMIETAISERMERATNTAMADCWSRLHTAVSHISDRLGDKNAIFRDSLIDNARETCAMLKRLNITNDANLDSMRVRVETELLKYGPQTLRDFDSHRASTADKAARILDQMAVFYEPQTDQMQVTQ